MSRHDKRACVELSQQLRVIRSQGRPVFSVAVPTTGAPWTGRDLIVGLHGRYWRCRRERGQSILCFAAREKFSVWREPYAKGAIGDDFC